MAMNCSMFSLKAVTPTFLEPVQYSISKLWLLKIDYAPSDRAGLHGVGCNLASSLRDQSVPCKKRLLNGRI
jgi:hypothetical protein